MKIYITDESVYKLCWASHHPANLFRNLYKLFIGVYCSQIASPNYKYLNINESGSLELMQRASLIKLLISRNTQLYFYCMLLFFFLFYNQQNFFIQMEVDPNLGEGGRSELLTFTDEIFLRGLSTEIPMKMQNGKWDIFFSYWFG